MDSVAVLAFFKLIALDLIKGVGDLALPPREGCPAAVVLLRCDGEPLAWLDLIEAVVLLYFNNVAALL
jgi:hypothetical protein